MKTQVAPIQRCACGKKHASLPERELDPPVQRSTIGAPRGFDAEGVHPGVLRPSSGGAPLPGSVRERKRALGHDFAAVRVHHGGELPRAAGRAVIQASRDGGKRRPDSAEKEAERERARDKISDQDSDDEKRGYERRRDARSRSPRGARDRPQRERDYRVERDRDRSRPPTQSARLKALGTAADLRAGAKEAGIELGGAYQSGLIPKDPSYQATIDDEEDYTGRREEQILAQASELHLHAMNQDHGYREVEVQHGFGTDEDGRLRVFASANTEKGRGLLNDTLKNMPQVAYDATQSGDEHIRRIGNKFLHHEEQQKARRAAAEKLGDEELRARELASIDAADHLHGLIMGGTVEAVGVGLKGKRHAEQIVDAGMRDDGVEPRGIFGSKIRCASCSSQLGPNRFANDVAQVGKFYPSQVSPTKSRALFKKMARGTVKAVRNRTERPRSLSPAAVSIPKKKKPAPRPIQFSLQNFPPRKETPPRKNRPHGGR